MKKLIKGTNDLSTCYPSIAAEWHPTLNDSLTPDSIYALSNRTVWWLCSKGHFYSARIDEKAIQGVKCPYCNEYSVSL